MTDEVTDNGSRGLRKLCGEMDYDDWAMAAQARLGKRGLWDVIMGPRPARRELAVSEDECELELKRRIAQRAFEQSQKDQGIHSCVGRRTTSGHVARPSANYSART